MPVEVAREARRILVIDHNDAIHGDFKKTLEPNERPSARLARSKAALVGELAPVHDARRQMPDFEIQSAMQGQEGVTRLEQALQEGKPFSVAFVDMRMPPGWDGV